MKKVTGLLVLFVSVCFNLVAQPDWKATYIGQTAFVENKGQVVDEHGKKNSDVLFIYANGIFNLQLKKDGFSYELFEVTDKKIGQSEAGPQVNDLNEFTNLANGHRGLRSHRIDVKLQGANRNAIIAGDAPSGRAASICS